MEEALLASYERSVAALIAHASIHAPELHEESLRELVLRGERSLCDRCLHLRESLVSAAHSWRTYIKRRKRGEDAMTSIAVAARTHELGMVG